MKSVLSLTGLVLFSLFAVIMFTGVECNDDSEDDNNPTTPLEKCGPEITKKIFLDGAGQLNAGAHYNGVDGEWAVFTYSIPGIDDICAHEHISGYFTFYMVNQYQSEVSYSAEVMYGILFTYPINYDVWETATFGQNLVVKRADFNFGIKNVYGDNPGWAVPFLTIRIKDHGSDDVNISNFNGIIDALAIELKYRKWKDNSG